MNHALRISFTLAVLILLSASIARIEPAYAQGRMSVPTSPDACPLQLSGFHAAATFSQGGVGLKVRNITKNDVVGMVFEVALADAAENWKWLHWNFDDTRPLRDFGWNKPIKPGEAKNLSWDSADLDFQHNGGGAFVLTSVLFSDGSGYSVPQNNSICKLVWYNGNKKGLVRPVDLPPRI
jgi:hypothetical protein